SPAFDDEHNDNFLRL
uniref:Extended FMRFamide-12 n=1 Tax=Lobatophasma redelinghuysense TaxID=253128 RepID=FAR12_LOBRE|nr:RecName: Full=Extended FMRFamide-12; Short=FMRFa-12 [Lobatophasma redelinghuysense]